jgi:polyisoprenoid-binding protein YceI
MRLFKSGLIGVALLLLGNISSIAGETYRVDPAHSMVTFTVRHMVIAKVTGRFTDFSGTIYFDEKDISRSWAKGSIKVASIDTDNEKRDDHLRSADFFDAAKYPEITFATKKIVKKGEDLVAVGDLTIKGVTKEVEIPFKVLGVITDPMGNKRLGLEASLTINRQDFGVNWNRTLDSGGVVVSNTVHIQLNVEAIQVKE